MAEPCASVSVLPMPANRIAAVPPLMLPALKTEEPPPPATIPYWPPATLAPAFVGYRRVGAG
jgi:hypothetical protein